MTLPATWIRGSTDYEKKVEDGFRELRTEMNALQRSMVQFAAVLVAALIGVIATQLGLILTQI